MELLVEIVKFIIYSMIIVLVSKYALVKILRKMGEILNLKPKVIGNIAGVATSIPEFLTVSFSALTGLIATSTYNIISSNIINVIQYAAATILNKNQKVLRNRAIKIDLLLVAITIVVPIMMMLFHIENQIFIVPVFIVLFLIFYKITNNAHRLYMPQKEEEEEIEKVKNGILVENSRRKKFLKVTGQGILLILVGIILYVIGNLLSNVLDNLCVRFRVPEIIVGILLGFITSIPELITFFESQKHHDDDKEGVVEATSNLLTSNIMNLFVIQSIGICIYFFISK